MLANSSHGGKAVSSFLQANLAQIIETVTPNDIEPTVTATVEAGGYFKRWRGGALKRWTEWAQNPADVKQDCLTLDERLTLAFLKVIDESKGAHRMERSPHSVACRTLTRADLRPIRKSRHRSTKARSGPDPLQAWCCCSPWTHRGSRTGRRSK